MKKLLATLLAMTMLGASMAVLAEGEAETVVDPNLVYAYGWEDDETLGFYANGNAVAGSFTTVGATTLGEGESAVTVTPHGGEKMLKLAGLDNGSQNNMFPARATMEWGTKYKVSFWYYDTAGTSPKFFVSCGGGDFRNNGNWWALNHPTANTWTYYEIFFVTADSGEAANPAISLYLRTATGDTEFYDDLRIEKAEGANISYSTTAPGVTSLATVRADGSRLAYFVPQKEYTIGGEKPQIPAIGVKTTPAEVATGTINVVSQYTPSTLTEKTSLITVVYTKKDNKMMIADVLIKPCDYTATAVYDKAEPPVFQYYQLETGINSQTVDMTKYEEGSFLKSFMWSSAAGLLPVSGTETLPAAAPAVPVE